MKSESVTWKLGDVFLDRRSELHVVAARILRQSDWAEDVLHDTYLKLSTCSREQVVLNPFGYCCQAVRNTALDHVRRRELEAHLILSSDDEEPPEMIDEREASSGIDERKLLQLIEATLSALPERAQLVFRLHRVEGKTQREIGRMVGVSATLVNFTLRDVTQALEPLRSAWG